MNFQFPETLFGIPMKRKKEDFLEKDKSTFAIPMDHDGATIVETGTSYLGAYSSSIDFEGQFKTEQDLIRKYRDVSMQPEADDAIQSIVDEAIVIQEDRKSVEVVLDDTNFSNDIKTKICNEFEGILSLLRFNDLGLDIFKNWYIDGRIFYHIIKDPNNLKNGIRELRRISPLQIKKIIKVEKESKLVNGQSVEVIKNIDTYYVFIDEKLYYKGQGLRINPDEICFAHSGLYDRDNKFIISNVHKAIKPINQLRMIEDAVIIYRLARAPERRVFYIDVGNLPKQKAEQVMKSLIAKYRNKVTYDAVSGEVSTTTNQMSMMEDFWLPRRDGGKGTQVETLQGGQNLGEIEDVMYFQKRMYKSLNVPVSRLEATDGFNLGRASEISRDELKFSKFVSGLRRRFSNLFLELIRVQLILKNIVTQEEWEEEKNNIRFDFLEDNHFAELKSSEIMAERLARLDSIDTYVGKYYSIDWVRKNVLMQTEEEIAELDKQMKEEESAGMYDDGEDNLGDENNTKSPTMMKPAQASTNLNISVKHDPVKPTFAKKTTIKPKTSK